VSFSLISIYVCVWISYANGELSKLGYDVVTIDGSVSRDTARDTVAGRAGLQGNYDPRELVDDGHHTHETVRQTARQLLMELGPQRLIANLGEGLGGNESPSFVEAFVDAIHQESKEMISSQN
jgi:uroporphyrinogen decarboxylase